jgi:P-type Cu+ transporter
MKKLKVSIQGMHCAACAANVEKSLKINPKIKNVSVSVITNKAIIEAEDSINEEEIKKAIDKVGYKTVAIN